MAASSCANHVPWTGVLVCLTSRLVAVGWSSGGYGHASYFLFAAGLLILPLMVAVVRLWDRLQTIVTFQQYADVCRLISMLESGLTAQGRSRPCRPVSRVACIHARSM